MLRGLRNKSGQGISSEYSILLILAVAAVVSMSVYVRRTFQGRMHDVQTYAQEDVAKVIRNEYGNAPGNVFANAVVRLEYEPYYVASRSENDQKTETYYMMQNGYYSKTVNSTQNVRGESQQLPPKDAD